MRNFADNFTKFPSPCGEMIEKANRAALQVLRLTLVFPSPCGEMIEKDAIH